MRDHDTFQDARLRETMDGAANALIRALWRLPEAGAVDAAINPLDPLRRKTRETMRELEKSLAQYLGDGGPD